MLLDILVLLDSILQTQLFQINQSEDSSKISIMSDTNCGQLHQRPITSASNYNRITLYCDNTIPGCLSPPAACARGWHRGGCWCWAGASRGRGRVSRGRGRGRGGLEAGQAGAHQQHLERHGHGCYCLHHGVFQTWDKLQYAIALQIIIIRKAVTIAN